MAFEALLHAFDGEQGELTLLAQIGHERGALAGTRIVDYSNVACIDLTIHGELQLINPGDHLRPVGTGRCGSLNHVHFVFDVVAEGWRIFILQIPVDAIQTDMRTEGARLRRGQPVVRILRALDGRRQSAGHGADQRTV